MRNLAKTLKQNAQKYNFAVLIVNHVIDVMLYEGGGAGGLQGRP